MAYHEILERGAFFPVSIDESDRDLEELFAVLVPGKCEHRVVKINPFLIGEQITMQSLLVLKTSLYRASLSWSASWRRLRSTNLWIMFFSSAESDLISVPS